MTSRPSRPSVDRAPESPTRASDVCQADPTTVRQVLTPDSGSIPQSAVPSTSRSRKVATIVLPARWNGARAGPGPGSGDGRIVPCSGSSMYLPLWPDAAHISRSDRVIAKAGPEDAASGV